MKKIIATLLVGASLSLTACADSNRSADYTYEQQAPYADERTVGSVEEVAAPVATAPERVFETEQRK